MQTRPPPRKKQAAREKAARVNNSPTSPNSITFRAAAQAQPRKKKERAEREAQARAFITNSHAEPNE